MVVVGAAVVVGGGSSGGGGGGGTARVTGGGGGSPAQLSADLFLPGTGTGLMFTACHQSPRYKV